MRINGCVKIAAVLAGAVLLWTACAATPRAADSHEAATPQDKAHQQQLADMSEQDADDTEAPAPPKRRSADPSARGRRTGQRVIDQPGRR